MKAPLLSFICAFALLFSACSKEEPVTPKVEERYSVTLNVSTLSHDMVLISGLKAAGDINGATAGKKLSDVIDYLSYGVYDENGVRIYQRSIHKGGQDFGKIKQVFSKGKYKVVVLGRWEQGSELPWFYNDDSRIYSHSFSDAIFFNQFDLVVSDQNIEQNVQLKRKVGKLEVELTDKIPLNIEEIQYSVNGVSDWFVPKTNRGDNNLIFQKSTYFDYEGSPIYWEREAFSFYFFLDKDQETEVSVKLVALDRNREVVVEKLIENVPVNINRKTKVRGRLFDTTSDMTGQAFSISF